MPEGQEPGGQYVASGTFEDRAQAAELIRRHGAHLAERQDELVERLEAPYAPRIQRAIRDLLGDEELTQQDKAARLLELADRLGLIRQPAPEPLPPIDQDDVHLICWIAILPGV